MQSIFWFYPPVWFIGQQLWRERERACDQAVLDRGTSPQVYAESILKVCRFYQASPPACAAGISGSQLRKRMEEIMDHRPFLRFSRLPVWSMRALLVVTLLCPVTYGMLRPNTKHGATKEVTRLAASVAVSDQVPAYQSVSIALSQNPKDDIAMMLLRPEGWSVKNVTLRGIILAAYGLQDSQLTGGPDWVNTARFDIEAKAPAEAVEAAKREGDRPLLPGKMVQALLADRFRLVLDKQETNEPVLTLVVAEKSPNLAVARPGDDYANGFKGSDGKPVGPGIWEYTSGGQIQLTAQGLPVFILVRFCSEVSKRLVVDRTGLAGKYDFKLTVPAGGADPANPMFNFTEQSLNSALQQQLGLKLEQQNAPVEHVTIQHAALIAEEK